MLHTKFQDHWTSGSDRRFLKVCTVYVRGDHPGHVTWTIYTNFRYPFPSMLHMKFGFEWPRGFERRRSLKMMDERRAPEDADNINTP